LRLHWEALQRDLPDTFGSDLHEQWLDMLSLAVGETMPATRTDTGNEETPDVRTAHTQPEWRGTDKFRRGEAARTCCWTRNRPQGWNKGCTHLWDIPGHRAAPAEAMARMPSDDKEAPADLRAFPKGFGAACKRPVPAATDAENLYNPHPVGRGDWRDAHAHLGTDARSVAWSAFGPGMRHPGDRPGLKYDWRTIAYTDGSVIKTNTGTPLVGAGVYMPCAPGTGLPMTHLVAPGGEGPSNTITRAEVAAIWAALRMGATTIMSDSAAALWLVRRAVMDPMSLRRHLHRPLLEEVADLIDKAESPITFLKCKAHSGIYGNEMADRAAKAAGQTRRPDATCDVEPHPFKPLFWPVKPEGDDPHYLSDLSKGLRDATKRTCSLGAAPTDGVYVAAWQDTAPHALGALSNGFTDSRGIGLATKRMVWKARCGLLWNKKLEQRYTKQGDGLCPLCGQPDGTRHIISGCQALTGLYTERHNAVARLVLKAIRKGTRGAEVVQHDVGSATKLAAAGMACSQQGRLIPADTLPDSVLQQHGYTRDTCSRPDITLDRQTAEREDPADYTPQVVHVVEIKVCNDTDTTGQLQKAESQHAALLNMLQSHYGPDRVRFVPLLFGATGTIYASSKPELASLGVPIHAANRTLAAIHNTLCHHLHAIVGARRAREHARPPGGRGSVT